MYGKNYLQERAFAVKIEKTISESKKILAGCPQDGIISAVLFIIYITDFPTMYDKIIKIKNIFFADDAIVYAVTNKIKNAQLTLNKYLNIISNYTKNWKLKLNEDKCEQISIMGHQSDLNKALRKKALKVALKINEKTLKNCEKVKYLGIVICKDFKFIKHVDHIIKKVNIAKAELCTAFLNKFIKKKIKILCHKQLIRPIILYASACWLNISSHQMERIREMERNILIMCTSLHRNKKNT